MSGDVSGIGGRPEGLAGLQLLRFFWRWLSDPSWQDRLRTLMPDDPEEGEKEQQEKEALSDQGQKMDPAQPLRNAVQ